MSIKTSWVSNTFKYLHQHPTQNMYGREMVGDVIPHILIARNKDEMIDTSVIQLTNTLLPVAAGYMLDAVYNDIQKCFRPLKTAASKNWFGLGKSLALYGFLAAVPISNAFIRNWVTAKRTQSVGFVDMIGEKKFGLEATAKHQAKIEAFEHNIASILATGIVASAALFGVTQLLIRSKMPFGKIPRLLADYLALPGGKFELFAKPKKALFGKIALPPILIWGLPIYAGLFSASRDQFEFKELVLRFGAFISSFFILPKLAKDWSMKHTPRKLAKLTGSKANAAMIVELLTTSVLFAIIPPLINILLTKKRVKNEGKN